ncbi:MAG TPA: adenylate/guanylate cyclase domain-containing protein, partial [Dehalococcoidia bacterium]
QAVRDSDDFFGTNVTLAFRIAALGAGGQILVSDALRGLAGPAFSFADGRDADLKGISELHRVFEVRWE